MAFSAHQKEVAAETSEAMERRFRPIAPKPLPASPPSMPIGTTVSSILLAYWGRISATGRIILCHLPCQRGRGMRCLTLHLRPVWQTTNDGEVPVVMRAWCMPESFLPGCEEHLQGLSLEGSSISLWASSQDAGRLFPVERDLISKLQVPKVIRPRPARPVRTIICIDCRTSSLMLPPRYWKWLCPTRRREKWRLSWSCPMLSQPSYRAATITTST